MQYTNYDPETGLAYTEVSTHVKSMVANWPEKTRGSLTTLQKYRNPKGAGSLQKMSMRNLLLNLHCLDEDSFDAHTGRFRQKIWKEICQHELDSLKTWTTFVKIFSKGTHETLPQHRRNIKAHHDFDHIIKHITSPSAQWLTYLTLSNVPLSLFNLVSISRITNLAALVVEEGHRSRTATIDHGIDDRVLGAWARHASATGSESFRRLRFLMICDYHYINTTTLDQLAVFPALTLCCLRSETGSLSSNMLEQSIAKMLGWTSLPGRHAHHLEGQWSRASNRSNALNNLVAYADLLADGTKESATSQLPTLNFLFGPGRYSERMFSSQDTLWVQRPGGSRQVVVPQRQERPPQSGTAKKRKIREGRVGSLDAALQDYGMNFYEPTVEAEYTV